MPPYAYLPILQVLVHTRGALCTINAADAPGFKGSDPRYARCTNSR